MQLDSSAQTEESSKVSGHRIHKSNWKDFKDAKLLWRVKYSVYLQYLEEVFNASFNPCG